MKLKLIVLFILSLASAPLFATPVLDSIGVENQNGKKVILHKLDPKDNYYAVGRRYNVKPNVIIQFNNNAPLKIGGIIKVPTEIPFDQQSAATATKPVETPAVQATVTQPAVTDNKQTAPTPQQAPVTTDTNAPATQDYKVSAGETLFAIARRFNTKVEDIISLNKLTSNNLVPGQILKVKASNATPAVATPAPVITTPAVDDSKEDNRIVATRDSTTPVSTDTSNLANHPGKFGLYEKSEKGLATWMDDAGIDPTKKLVLHRTAPIGTVIKIVNSNTNRTTFAKVVGRFTDNEATKDVVIVMTKSVATSLGAIDKRFHVTLSYGTPNE